MKSLLLYLVLVITPLLGLLGILQIGEKLQAPAPVGGIWAVEPGTSEALKQSCAPLKASGDRLEMTLSQSGRYVQLQFNDAEKTTMTGRFDDSVLTLRQILGSGVRNRCGSATAAALQLRHTPTGAERLSGTWKIPECDDCSQISFIAVRLTEPLRMHSPRSLR